MNLNYFKNKGEGEYEIVLSGDVGEHINTREIAREIRYLNSIGAKKITERINSPGGYVVEGYDIVDANINSTAIIETIITGLAASTAGWLAATGTKGHRFIVDYGKAMVHDPSLGMDKIEDLPEGSDKEGLIQIKDSIVTILSNHSNLDKNEISGMMTKETWMDAKTWVKNGFADKVVATTDKPLLKENYSILEFINACNEFKINHLQMHRNQLGLNDNTNKMKKVLTFLNLSEDASEDSALNAVQKISEKVISTEKKVSDQKTEIDNLTNKISEKDTEIKNLKTEIDGYKEKENSNAVKAAIESGKFSEENKEELTNQCKAMGVENFNKMVEMVKLPQANAANQVNNSGTGDKKTVDEKLAEEYQKLAEENPGKLQEIKDKEPARFDKMFEAWENWTNVKK